MDHHAIGPSCWLAIHFLPAARLPGGSRHGHALCIQIKACKKERQLMQQAVSPAPAHIPILASPMKLWWKKHAD